MKLKNGQKDFTKAFKTLVWTHFELAGRIQHDEGLPFDREAAAVAMEQISQGIGALQKVTGEEIKI